MLPLVERAAGIDHSPDMLALAADRNAAALGEGRLQLVEGEVHELPWPDGEFTCAACLNAFFFNRPEVLRSMLLDAGFAEATVDESSGQQLAVARQPESR